MFLSGKLQCKRAFHDHGQQSESSPGLKRTAAKVDWIAKSCDVFAFRCFQMLSGDVFDTNAVEAIISAAWQQLRLFTALDIFNGLITVVVSWTQTISNPKLEISKLRLTIEYTWSILIIVIIRFWKGRLCNDVIVLFNGQGYSRCRCMTLTRWDVGVHMASKVLMIRYLMGPVGHLNYVEQLQKFGVVMLPDFRVCRVKNMMALCFSFFSALFSGKALCYASHDFRNYRSFENTRPSDSVGHIRKNGLIAIGQITTIHSVWSQGVKIRGLELVAEGLDHVSSTAHKWLCRPFLPDFWWDTPKLKCKNLALWCLWRESVRRWQLTGVKIC